MDVRRADRPLTDVVAAIFTNLQDMLRSEIQLAQSQARDELARARPAAILLGAGVAAALLSVYFALVAIFEALRLAMPPWAAALCLAAVLAVVCAVAVSLGLKRFRALPPVGEARLMDQPARMEESVEWANEQTR